MSNDYNNGYYGGNSPHPNNTQGNYDFWAGQNARQAEQRQAEQLRQAAEQARQAQAFRDQQARQLADMAQAQRMRSEQQAQETQRALRAVSTHTSSYYSPRAAASYNYAPALEPAYQPRSGPQHTLAYDRVAPAQIASNTLATGVSIHGRLADGETERERSSKLSLAVFMSLVLLIAISATVYLRVDAWNRRPLLERIPVPVRAGTIDEWSVYSGPVLERDMAAHRYTAWHMEGNILVKGGLHNVVLKGSNANFHVDGPISNSFIQTGTGGSVVAGSIDNTTIEIPGNGSIKVGVVNQSTLYARTLTAKRIVNSMATCESFVGSAQPTSLHKRRWGANDQQIEFH